MDLQAEIKELIEKLAAILPDFIKEVEILGEKDHYMRIGKTFRKIVHFTGDYDEGRIIEAVTKYLHEKKIHFNIYTKEYFTVLVPDEYDFTGRNLAFVLLTVLYVISNDWES
jgi:hypothetical protein